MRCAWVPLNDILYEKYHDTEWGTPVHDDMKLFEFIVLEGAQAGLSWRTILSKRENYRDAFDNFDFRKIALYGDEKIAELLDNALIVRNRLKIRSALTNATAAIQVSEEFGSFSEYIWSFTGGKTIVGKWSNISEIPTRTALSDKISRDMKKRGFSFVGSTIIYSFLQATGIVNDHTTGCFRYSELIS